MTISRLLLMTLLTAGCSDLCDRWVAAAAELDRKNAECGNIRPFGNSGVTPADCEGFSSCSATQIDELEAWVGCIEKVGDCQDRQAFTDEVHRCAAHFTEPECPSHPPPDPIQE